MAKQNQSSPLCTVCHDSCRQGLVAIAPLKAGLPADGRLFRISMKAAVLTLQSRCRVRAGFSPASLFTGPIRPGTFGLFNGDHYNILSRQ